MGTYLVGGEFTSWYCSSYLAFLTEDFNVLFLKILFQIASSWVIEHAIYVHYFKLFHCRSVENREGYEPELAAVLTGSHIDAIPYSGKYDGVVGVMGAIEAINVLKRYAGVQTVVYFGLQMEVCNSTTLLYSYQL